MVSWRIFTREKAPYNDRLSPFVQLPGFAEEASRRNDRGNLPLHAACSFQPTTEVIEMLIRSYPEGPRVANNIGNLPLHQAAMWQASVEVLDILLEAFPEGSAVRNQYGSLPLHMASSNQAKMETIRRLMEVYPEAVHLQNDDGMTPLDLVLADESPNEAVVAMLEGRPPPPELSKRDQSEKYKDRADAMERKLAVFRDSSGQQRGDLDLALLAIRKLADTIPHSLYAAGMDPNELEIALSEVPGGLKDAEDIILQLVKKSVAEKQNGSNGKDSSKLEGSEAPIPGAASSGPVRDRVEDLLDTIVGLSHLKSQVSYSMIALFCVCFSITYSKSLFVYRFEVSGDLWKSRICMILCLRNPAIHPLRPTCYLLEILELARPPLADWWPNCITS